MSRTRTGAAWGSLVTGLASVATLPVAVYLTRFSERYELLHSGFAIPLAALLGIGAIALSSRARRRNVLLVERARGHGIARAGNILGVVGVCMALAAVVALIVYALLEEVGSRE